MKKLPVILILLLATLGVVPLLAQSPKYPPLSEYTMARDAEIALPVSDFFSHLRFHSDVLVVAICNHGCI